jgi:hypothetical protein
LPALFRIRWNGAYFVTPPLPFTEPLPLAFAGTWVDLAVLTALPALLRAECLAALAVLRALPAVVWA